MKWLRSLDWKSWKLWLGIVLGIVGVVFIGSRIGRTASAQAPGGAETRSEVISQGPIELTVSGTGRIEPAALALLSFRVPGNVLAVHVAVGDVVQAGQVLLELDPASLDPSLLSAEGEVATARQALQDLLESASQQQIAETELALAQARDELLKSQNRRTYQQAGNRATPERIAAAEANLVLAERAVDAAEDHFSNFTDDPVDDPERAQAYSNLDKARQARNTALATLNWYTGRPTENDQAILDATVAVAQANVDEAEETLAELRAGPDPDAVAAAEARLRAAESHAGQARLVAPIDATVVGLAYAEGDSVTTGVVAITLAATDQLHVDTLVDELDIARVEPGQPVELTFDALPDLRLQGEVNVIELIAEQGATTAYPVRVVLTEGEEEVRLGMTASVEILVERKEAVILVPNWALGFDAATGEIFVLVRRGPELVRTPLVLGLRSETFSEVLEGLQVGDVVEVPAASALQGPGGGQGSVFFGGGG